MSLLVNSTDTRRPEWVRQVAFAVNWLLKARAKPFGDPVNTLPASPEIGQAVIDGSDGNRAKVWDGSAWQGLW